VRWSSTNFTSGRSRWTSCSGYSCGCGRPCGRICGSSATSATLATEPVARLLGGHAPCPVVAADGRLHPVTIRYEKHGDQRTLADRVAATVPAALRETTGHVLVFLPGVGEIMQCERLLAEQADRQGHVIFTLFGDLPPEQQDRVLDDLPARKIILSTNVAETSLTIPGITAVVDSGLVRQAQGVGRHGPAGGSI